MGIGTLRRYHKPLTSAGVGSSGPADAGKGQDKPTELEQAVLDAQTALDAARTASEEANTAAFADTANEELEATREAKAEEARLAQVALEEAQLALDEFTLATQLKAEADAKAAAEATKHGELEQPLRMGSTDLWIAYAAADPAGPPFDLTKRTGLRDEIAAHYLDKA